MLLKPIKTSIDSFIFIEYDGFKLKDKIACFDIDQTIIMTKSKKKFPTDKNDWILLFKNKTKDILNAISKNGFSIILISNQAGLKTSQQVTDWIDKITNIINYIQIPMRVYASITKNEFRKPLPTLWHKIMNDAKNENIVLKLDECYYCGDAAGRAGDHAGTDYKFALNANLKFYTPEHLFLDDTTNKPVLEYITFPKRINYKFDKNIVKGNKIMILMVGYPASGKSSFVSDYLMPHGFMRINQDTLKTKKKCLDKAIEYINNESNFVVDNLNCSKSIRNEYIKLANKNNYIIKAIVMTTSYDVAYHNNIYRSIITNGLTPPIPAIVYNKFKKEYQVPEKNEGFQNILFMDFNPPCTCTEDGDDVNDVIDKKYLMYLS